MMKIRLSHNRLAILAACVALAGGLELAGHAQNATNLLSDWNLFGQNPQRTGFNSRNGTLNVVGFGVNGAGGSSGAGGTPVGVSPGQRWTFPHTVDNGSDPNHPFLFNLGNMQASPVAGHLTGTGGSDFAVIGASFQSYTIFQDQSLLDTAAATNSLGSVEWPPVGKNQTAGTTTATLGTVFALNGFDGIDATPPHPYWSFGWLDVPFAPPAAGATPTQAQVTDLAEHQFLVSVSSAIVKGFPGYTPNDPRLSQPMGAVRSTPALYNSSGSIPYATRFVQLNGQSQTLNGSTSDIVVFGDDDGFVYCLDANPLDAIQYTATDTSGGSHSVSVPPLMWRFDTQKILGTDPGQTVQVLSSPVVTEVGGRTLVLIGSGSGYLFAIDASTGQEAWHTAASTLGQITPAGGTTTRDSNARFPITASPTLDSDDGLVIFGAQDSVVYAVSYTDTSSGLHQPVWTYTTGQLSASAAGNPNAAPGDRSALQSQANPPIVGASALATTTAGRLLFVPATGRPDAASNNGGQGAVLYALNPANGHLAWKFDSYHLPTDPTGTNRMPGPFRATPAVAAVKLYGNLSASDVVFARSDDGNLYALFAADGTMAWDLPTALEGENVFSQDQVTSSPAISSDGVVFLGSNSGVVRGIAADGHTSVQLANGQQSGQLRTGNEVWRVQTGILAYGTSQGAPPVTDRNDTGSQVSVTLQDSPVLTTPAIARNYLFVGGSGYLIAYQNRLGGSGSPGYRDDFFRPGGVSASQVQRPNGVNNTTTPGGTQGVIQVDIFPHDVYTSAAPVLDATHSTSLGGDNTPLASRWILAHPGQVEWGDPIYVIAWDLDERSSTAILRLQGPNGTIQQTVPVHLRKSATIPVGKRGIAHYAFYLDPVTQYIVNPLRPDTTMRNPVYRNPLTPGGFGSASWTVTAQENTVSVSVPDAKGKTRVTVNANQVDQSSSVDTKSRFKINNPIELFDETRGGIPITREDPLQAQINGNTVVPLAQVSLGDHGSFSSYARFRVGDRSHLSLVKPYDGNLDAPDGTLPRGLLPGSPAFLNSRPVLRVKVQPAELQWMGGPASVYKPLFPVDFATGQQMHPVSQTTPFAGYDAMRRPEVQPDRPGMPNRSPDYPNIPAERMEVMRVGGIQDAIHEDAEVPPVGPSSLSSGGGVAFAYRVNVPKYQPANGDPRYGIGFGYQTVNPTNNYAIDVLQSKLTNVAYHPNLPIDNIYLTRVYVDTNRNSSHDFNEAYRVFVARCNVRVDESFQVVESTVDIPGPPPGSTVPPPPGVPHGFVPFTSYWPGLPGNDPQLVAAESPFYRPFTIVNTGNVNLWNVRMARNNPNDQVQVPPLVSDTVDPNPVEGRSANGNSARYTGVIDAANLQSTLDVPPGVSPANPAWWTAVAKPRVNSPDPQRIDVTNVFAANGMGVAAGQAASLPHLPYISVGVPIGTPVGKYTTQPVFFEDGTYNGTPRLVGANGIIDRYETVAPTKMKVSVEVMEARLTGYPPLPVYASASLPTGMRPLMPIPNIDTTATLGSNAVPTAYRDENGNMVVFWSTNRVNSSQLPGSSATVPGSTTDSLHPWLLANSSLAYDPKHSPWGFNYVNDSQSFFNPQLNSQWWQPVTQPYPIIGNQGLNLFDSPGVAEFEGREWLFFAGQGNAYSPATGYSTQYRLLYTALQNGRPAGQPMTLPGDSQSPREWPRPFQYFDGNGQPRLGLIWYGGDPGHWRLFVSTTSNPSSPSSWTAPVALPLPDSLVYALQPSPVFKFRLPGGYTVVDVVFSGLNRADGNADLFLMRFRTDSWTPVPLPQVNRELAIRDPGRPVFTTTGTDWNIPRGARAPQVEWQKVQPNGAYAIFRRFQVATMQNGVLVYTDPGGVGGKPGIYTLTVDPSSGTLRFSSDDPSLYPLPGRADRVYVAYSPLAWRLTTDPRSDTEPSFFIDRSVETFGPDRANHIPPGISTLYYRVPRDRMWLIWRRGNSGVGGGEGGTPGANPGKFGVGTPGSSTLFYKTMRLAVQLPGIIASNQKGVPQVSVTGNSGPYSVDPVNGRLFFTEKDEGHVVNVSVNGFAGQYTVTWQPEATDQRNAEVAVPIKGPIDEGQAWAFKDPWSDLSPTDPNYLARVNNDVWIFWSSTRNGTSDIYYMAISPRF